MKQKSSRFAVVIPAYNEEKNIGKVLEEAKKYASLIFVVDDGSNDRTALVAEKAGIKVLRHVVNLGKGAALKTGCLAAFKLGVEAVITIDADGQHKPEDIPRFLKTSALEKVDLVLSFRQLNSSMPLVRLIGNKIACFLLLLFFNIKVTDPLCGFRFFTKKAYQELAWESTGYAVETEMLAKAALKKIRFVEIPTETLYTDKYKGVSFFDGLKVFFDVLKWRFLK